MLLSFAPQCCPQFSTSKPKITVFLFFFFRFSIRYNQGVTDIHATSINVIGEPRDVFTEIRRGTVGTK